MEHGELVAEVREVATYGYMPHKTRVALGKAADALEAAQARIAALEAELAGAREALEVFGGEAAIEAKRLFNRMVATPRHTAKRKQLAAAHVEASRRAAVARALKAAQP